MLGKTGVIAAGIVALTMIAPARGQGIGGPGGVGQFGGAFGHPPYFNGAGGGGNLAGMGSGGFGGGGTGFGSGAGGLGAGSGGVGGLGGNQIGTRPLIVNQMGYVTNVITRSVIEPGRRDVGFRGYRRGR